MKIKSFIVMLLVAALAGSAGWFAAKRAPGNQSENAPANSARKVLYYQSPMHPWIKSDQPGNCTICGMKLTPVYEGEKGFDAGTDMVHLGSNVINVIHVQTEEAVRRPLTRTIRVAGTIDDNDTKHRFVSAYVDGRIDQLAVNYVGAEVVQGEPLATFYSPTLLTAQREYMALVRQQPASGSSAINLENHRLISAAAERLRLLGLSDAQIRELDPAQDTNEHTLIRAPISGSVVQRFVYEGQYVKEGDKLFEIADFSTMWFVFDAYERDLAWIRPGQNVRVTTPAVPGKAYSAPITFINPNISDMSRSAKVRVEMENPLVEQNGHKRRELLHKFYAEGIVQAETEPVLAIPRSAVLAPGPRAVAYVSQGDGHYQQRTLKLGRMGDDYWEVLEGIAEGEKIVTNGNMLIDAQAQLNQSAQPATAPSDMTSTTGANHASTTPVHPASPLTDAQKSALRDFFVVVNDAGSALAADDVAKFNQHALRFHQTVPALAEALADAEAWKPYGDNLNKIAHLAPAADLTAARKEFYPVSVAAVELTKALRERRETVNELKIYKCPMTSQAFPGAPKIGFWVQTGGPLRNPYFGKEMLDCGTEVKP